MSQQIERIRTALESGRLTINRLDDGTAVLLDIEGEQAMTLNSTGLQLIDWIEAGAESESELAKQLASTYPVDLARAEEDAAAFIQTAADALNKRR